jgi:RNA polymerase sigma factor (sigma-70 family)
MDDHELLQAWAAGRAEEAFRTLTDRYLNLVYSAAVRQSSSTEAAQDITQAVFLTLADKAASISPNVILAGWLLRTTRYAAANARRLEQRRQHYEEQAMHALAPTVCPGDLNAAWERIAPLLDEAIDGLAEKDRSAVVLRFFEQWPLKRVAEKLGVSEDGAQKRVSRALEKLRAFFARHGRVLPLTTLAAAMAAGSVHAAPLALGSIIVSGVMTAGVAGVAGAGAAGVAGLASASANAASSGSWASALAHATVRSLTHARIRFVAVRAGSVAMVAGLTLFLALRDTRESTAKATAAPPVAPLPAASASADQASPPAALAAAAVVEPERSLLPHEGVLLLEVLDEQTQSPVTNAVLTLMSVTQFPARATNVFVTGRDGRARVVYSAAPVKYWNHRIEIYRDGYVPKFVSWSEGQVDRLEEIPAEYTVRVERAVRIGGLVVDEQDGPVAGARVIFSVSGPTSRARERLTMMGDYHFEDTDATGHWSCTHVPARFGRIDFRPLHPSFQEQRWVSDSPEATAYRNAERIAEADFLAGRAQMRLKAGLAVGGLVVDENGRPVTEARVTQNFDFQRADRTRVTGPDGVFSFGNARPGHLSLTIQAASYGPVVTSLVMNASEPNLRLVLPVGRMLSGRVVDETGQPIVGATIEAASPSADSRTFFQWRTKSDGDGRFAWDAAPLSQEYAISADGFELVRRARLAADGTEQSIRLTKKSGTIIQTILGDVLDAESRQPLTGAKVQLWESQLEKTGPSSFSTRAEPVGPDGQFRRKTSPGTISYVLGVTADGYWPQSFTNEIRGEREARFAVELRRAPIAAGVVLTPSGEPAAGATLVVCTRYEAARMMRPGQLVTDDSGNGLVSTHADGAGRFRLPVGSAPEAVAIAHATGFLDMPFAAVSSNAIVTLQPWARLEGTVTAGGVALAGETVRVAALTWRMNQSPHVSVYVEATTDAQGHFEFLQLPPGEWKVQREINHAPPGWTGVRIPAFSHGVCVLTRAGESVKVTLGGAGRSIVGRLTAPVPVGPDVWTENFVLLRLKLPAELTVQPKLEAGLGNLGAEARRVATMEASLAYWNSEAGRARQRDERQYGALLSPEGTFRVEDVPPGQYTLSVSLNKLPKLAEGNPPPFVPIAVLETEVTVAESDAGSGAGPVDLGTLTLVAPRPAG